MNLINVFETFTWQNSFFKSSSVKYLFELSKISLYLWRKLRLEHKRMWKKSDKNVNKAEIETMKRKSINVAITSLLHLTHTSILIFARVLKKNILLINISILRLFIFYLYYNPCVYINFQKNKNKYKWKRNCKCKNQHIINIKISSIL